MTKRNKPADVVFVLDATASTQSVFTGMVRYCEDLSTELPIVNRSTDFHYAAIIYRDPIDYHEIKGGEIGADEKKILEQIKAQMEEERIKKLKEKGLYDEELEQQRKRHFENIDHVKYPFNKNVAIPFTNNMENLVAELDKVECGSGGDCQEDWAGALELALGLTYRENSKKLIVWITDANAHGKSFNSTHFDNHNAEEARLEKYVKEMAQKRFYFIGINIMKDDDGCKLTLQAVKNWYETFRGPGFLIQEFHPIKDPDLDDDDWPPEELGKFADTLKTTMSGFKFE